MGTKKPKNNNHSLGNEWWKLRSKHGKDKLFKSPELLWEAAVEYFQHTNNTPIEVEEIKVVDNSIARVPNYLKRPYTLKALCLFLGTSDNYFIQFKREQKDKPGSREYLRVIAQIEDVIYSQKFDGATAGIFNARIISRDLGLIDRSEVKQENLNVNVTPTAKEAAEIRKAWSKKI